MWGGSMQCGSLKNLWVELSLPRPAPPRPITIPTTYVLFSI